ncbi:MAG TPA: AAA family ATPase [Actinomycetota bacterium]|nr:AAA family ATPase [Actinomycetota bacterium]
MGRKKELDALVGAFEDAREGRGRLFLLGGEPGIGKSRLADEVSVLAQERGAVVLWGRCWEAGGAPPYWPWVQVLRAHIRSSDPARLIDDIGDGAPDLMQVVPEIRRLLPEVPSPPAVDAETARFRLFQAMAELVRRAATTDPLVLLLDDLQAADEPSLLLLQFIARELADARVLLVGTYRDTDLTEDHPLMGALAELIREPVTNRLSLQGLPETDVGTLIEEVSGVSVTETVVTTLYRETEGNPLFLLEVVRLLAAEGRLETVGEDDRLTIPQGVREVIGRRLKRLSEDSVRVLSVASVLGREFSLEPLRRMTERSSDRLLEVLDEALAARLISEVPGALGRLRFSHALVADTFYERLSAAERLRHHRRAGEALEALYAPDTEGHLAEIAHHFIQAAPAGEFETAVRYAREAAEQALRQLAYEEAARLFGMALQALELDPAPVPGARADLLLALADAQIRSGDLATGKGTLIRAADAARRSAAADRLARAALAYGGRFVWPRAGSDPHMLPLLEEALEAVGPEDSEIRIRIQARLAAALRDEPSGERRTGMSQDAVAAARRLGDPSVLAYALAADLAAGLAPPGSRQDKLERAEELVRVATAAGDLELLIEGFAHQLLHYLAVGDGHRMRDAASQIAHVATELRQPAQHWLVTSIRAVLALAEGRPMEAETFLFRALELGERADTWQAMTFSRIQLFGVRRELGTLEGLDEPLEEAIREFSSRPIFRCILANLYVRLGRTDEARLIFDRLAEAEFSLIPRNNDWSLSVALLAETAVLLGDAARAEALYRIIEPHGGRNVDTLELTTGCLARQLGMLASFLGRWEDAERHFNEAREMNARMGFRTWLAHTLHAWGAMLLERDEVGDGDRGAELLEEAASAARALGLVALAADVDAALRRSGRSPMAAMPSRPEAPRAVFRREGEYFSIVYEGDAFRLKDSKGLRHLAQLLAHPGREIHALDLLTQAEGGPMRALAPSESGGMDVGGGSEEILDARAREEYRSRLRDLQEEIEEAESFGDAERAARAREEMEFLAAELAGATGLGGRARKAASDAERARVNVTKAIKVARDRIQQHSPALGRYLAATVRTGTFCSYMPDPRAKTSWRL